MRALRSALFSLFLVVLTIPYAIACFIAFPFMGAHRRYWMVTGWCRTVLLALRVLCGVRYRVDGRHNLPRGPVVLLSKHQSAWETLAFPAIMPTPLCYVFKRELLRVPFFGWALGMLKMIHIDRKRGGPRAFLSVIKQGRERLADGSWVVMFPEGTRTPVGRSGLYKSGGARFAIEVGAPVVPIALNAGHCWPRNSFVKHPGEIVVSIGPAIDSTGLASETLNRRVADWIEAEMRRIDAPAYRDETPPDAASGTAAARDEADLAA